LNAVGDAHQSTAVANRVFEAGYRIDELVQVVKSNYVQMHGSDSNYDVYLAGFKKQIQTKAKERLGTEMTSKPASAFALRNIKGKLISLSSLKGKVVVIDFWATWCMPCKESFPAAQRVLDHYVNDDKVEFLFIDTWESDKNFKANVKQFIADAKYTFNVLFDQRNPHSNKQDLIANSYQVEGIPTRFIIDKKGNICFTEVGYSGSFDQMYDDLITRVELAKER
jgi:thiol-disulfide isomerase/thioredoxin